MLRNGESSLDDNDATESTCSLAALGVGSAALDEGVRLGLASTSASVCMIQFIKRPN